MSVAEIPTLWKLSSGEDGGPSEACWNGARARCPWRYARPEGGVARAGRPVWKKRDRWNRPGALGPRGPRGTPFRGPRDGTADRFDREIKKEEGRRRSSLRSSRGTAERHVRVADVRDRGTSVEGPLGPGESAGVRSGDAPRSCRAGLPAHDLNYRTPPLAPASTFQRRPRTVFSSGRAAPRRAASTSRTVSTRAPLPGA